MSAQLSGVYFRSYQLAYDTAKRAERAFRHELGLGDSSYIQFGYWDSLKKGLLAGERLTQDLKRMEAAYLDLNRREYEITKHISLLSQDPSALIRLKMVGSCEVALPEWLFDMDYPGHFMRRIKSVGMTIPCVVGPYTNVNCKLTLLRSTVRSGSAATDPYPQDPTSDDPRFRVFFGATEAIVTTHGQNDAGLFEWNLRDERYLPFEGHGVISLWRIELPPDSNQFDLMSVNDVILHVRYTARDGGNDLARKAREALDKTLNADGVAPVLGRLFSARHDFSSQFAQFKGGWQTFVDKWNKWKADGGTTPEPTTTLSLDLSDKMPYLTRRKKVSISNLRTYIEINGALHDAAKIGGDKNGKVAAPTLALSAASNQSIAINDPPIKLGIDPSKITDLLVICPYTIQALS